jgi:putative transposase
VSGGCGHAAESIKTELGPHPHGIRVAIHVQPAGRVRRPHGDVLVRRFDTTPVVRTTSVGLTNSATISGSGRPDDWFFTLATAETLYFDFQSVSGIMQSTLFSPSGSTLYTISGAAVSATSVYRVLKAAGRLARSNWAPSKKGTRFVQPLAPHDHWHIDISYINVGGTFFYLCSILDDCSRMILHFELRERMTECDVEIVVQAAREKFPNARPRIISDNGPQFIAKDFKEFIRLCGMTHVRTSPYYPQSNGKLERWHKSLKTEAVRPGSPLTQEDAQRLIASYVKHYNTVRLHAAIGYVTPADKLAGRDLAIFAARDQKLAAARTARQARRPARGSHRVRPRAAEVRRIGLQRRRAVPHFRPAVSRDEINLAHDERGRRRGS